MEFVNVSLPWMPELNALIPKVVEKQLQTEQVKCYFNLVTVTVHCSCKKRCGRPVEQIIVRVEKFNISSQNFPVCL